MLKLSIKGTNLKLEPIVYDYIEDKIGTLDKFISTSEKQNENKFSFSPSEVETQGLPFIEKVDSVVQAWVEVGLVTRHHQSGNVYRAEVQIRLAGKSIRAEAATTDIFLAIDAVKDELQIELKKYKGKQEALHKRGGRILKKIFRFSPLARLWRKERIGKEGI